MISCLCGVWLIQDGFDSFHSEGIERKEDLKETQRSIALQQSGF